MIEWADTHTHDPSTPMHGWAEARVKEYLAARVKGKQTARTLTRYVTTYKDFQPWFLDMVMKRVAETNKQFGVLWIGISQCGESLGAQTHVFQISTWQINK